MHEPMEAIRRHAQKDALFSARNVSHRYPDQVLALRDINLDIMTGDRIALVGPNGSGKTTLIKQLCGLLHPCSGELLYKSAPLEEAYLNCVRLEIGLLFQDPDDQLFGYTLLEDVAFGPRHQGLSRVRAEQAALEALQRVSLDPMAYKAPHHLSFGQKKRAALAGLLAMQPAVLLLDEPTANLDPRQEQVFLDLLANFSGTLICSSHDLIFLYELCDRAVVLDHGRIAHDYTMRDIVSQRHSLRAHGLDFSFRLVVTPPADAPLMTTPMRAPQCPTPAPDSRAHQPLVQLRDYRFRYPDGTLALDGIDISISANERISLVGENGAGKTTLLACLLGLQQGNGEFLFNGRLVTRKRRKALWRQVGMVFQDCADQLFCPSVGEEIAFGLRQLGFSRAECRQKTLEALAMVHMQEFEERVPLHLSGGERKRVALASVLAMQPKLLILDEPTAGLDPQSEELLLEILRNLNTTLLIVSHDMFFVKELTCRTIVMHQGVILEDLLTQNFLQDQRLGNLNGLAFAFREHGGNAIRLLQHAHEHSQLHEHPHAHEEGASEHAHAHVHRYVHSHPGDEKAHAHAPRRFHGLDYSGHDEEPDHDRE